MKSKQRSQRRTGKRKYTKDRDVVIKISLKCQHEDSWKNVYYCSTEQKLFYSFYFTMLEIITFHFLYLQTGEGKVPMRSLKQ